MNQLESRQLRYFVAVAQELNFTRAAERLRIAPPALSRAIAQLETQVGVRLLERTTRSVALTAAGEVLLEQAQIALDAIDAAARRTRRAGERQRLIVALKADMDGGLLEPAMRLYAQECPEVPLEVLLSGFGEQPQMLRDGRADVALMYTGFDMSGLDHEILLEEPYRLGVSIENPLASLAVVTPDDLAASMDATRRPNIWQRRATAGRSSAPRRIGDVGRMLKLIELDEIAVLFPQSMCDAYPRPRITYLPGRQFPTAKLTVAWSQASASPAIAAFVRVVMKLAPAGASVTERAVAG